MLLSNMLLHIVQDTHELKQANTKCYPICLRRRPSIQWILSHLDQILVFWEERINSRTIFFVSRCCETADSRKLSHGIFCHYYIALTSFAVSDYFVQKPISQLFRNFFSIFWIAGLRTPLTSSRCQVGRSLPPSRAIHRTLPALQQVRPYYLKMLSIATITISISISILYVIYIATVINFKLSASPPLALHCRVQPEVLQHLPGFCWC